MKQEQSKYQNKYIKEKYDRINFTAPKGYKAKLEEWATKKGFKNTGEYIKSLIAEDMELGGD